MHTFFGRTLVIEFNFFQKFDYLFHNFDEYFSREIFEIFCLIFEKNENLFPNISQKRVRAKEISKKVTFKKI